jgi:anti-anti-sigma factor
MEIVVSHENGRIPITVFHITGEITAESSEELQQQAQSAFEAGTRNLLLDLTGVTFLSSRGLGAVHQIYMLLRNGSPGESAESVRQGIRAGTYRSAHLKLANPTRNVLRTIKLAGFDMFLDIHADLQGAMASF